MDDIEAKVADAVDEVRPAPDPPDVLPEPEAPLELEPLPPQRDEVIRAEAAERHRRQTLLRSIKVALIVLALAAVAGLAVATLDEKDVETLAGAVEERARKATEEESFYTFSDDDGVVHIVDDLAKVPKKYRARAKGKQ